MATPAYCQPEATIVPIVLAPSDSRPDDVKPLPSCTRLKRCGGCCSHPLVSCQPLEVENVTLVVFAGADSHYWEEVVTLEQHKRCQCQCKVKAEHCTPRQQYLPHECRCMCRNSNQEHLCRTRDNR